MRKWIVLLVILLIVVGALAFALFNLNSYLNRNREWLAARVESAIGRPVRFSEIGVSIFGGFGAFVTDLQIADDPAFSEEAFVRAGRAQVAVRILPALTGRYEVRYVRLQEPTVNVIKTARGFNFDSLGKDGTGDDTKAPDETPVDEAPASGRTSGPLPLLVSDLQIRRGRIRFQDRTAQPPLDLVVDPLDVTARNVGLDRPIDIEVDAALLESDERNLSLVGTIGPVADDVPSAPLDVRVTLGPLILDRLKTLSGLGAALPAELSSADPLTVQAQVGGSIGAPVVEASLDATAATLEYAPHFRKPSGVPLQVRGRVRPLGDPIPLETLALALDTLELRGSGHIRTGEPASIDLDLKSNRASLGGWEKLFPALQRFDVGGTALLDTAIAGSVGGGRLPRVTGTVALENVHARQAGSPYEIEGLTTTVQLEGESAVLPLTRFQLGGSPVQAQGKLQRLQPLEATFRIESPSLRAASLGLAAPDAREPEELRDLRLDGRLEMADGSPTVQAELRSKSGRVREIDYQELQADVRFRDQVATFSNLSLQAFGGRYDGKGTYDLRDPEAPQFDLDSKVQGIELRPLLAIKAPALADLIGGRLDADLDLAGTGTVWERLKQTLNGIGTLEIHDGVLEEVNLVEKLLTTLTGVPGLSNLISPRLRQKYPQLFGTERTTFETLRGAIEIADGRALVEKLTLAASKYTLNGTGSIGLDRTLDLETDFVASTELTQDLIDSVKQVKYLTDAQGRLALPFPITGNLPSIQPKLDIAMIAKRLQGGALQKTLDEGIEKGLGELFGRKKPTAVSEKREPAADGEKAATAPAAPEGTAPEAAPTRKAKPEEELLRKGIESLFGR